MRIILIIIVILGSIFGLGIFSLKTVAEEYTPLDFISDYKKFEATVGFDTQNGRYISYTYEFEE